LLHCQVRHVVAEDGCSRAMSGGRTSCLCLWQETRDEIGLFTFTRVDYGLEVGNLCDLSRQCSVLLSVEQDRLDISLTSIVVNHASHLSLSLSLSKSKSKTRK
jgi:hypothetical protein